MNIKVCGMTRIGQIEELSDMGVAFAGLIFYPNSSRYVFKHGLTGAAVRKSKLKLYKVGVFVDASYDEIMKQVDDFGLDMVQLHGRESAFECAKIAGNVDVIKAFRLGNNDHVDLTIREYHAASDMFLFDTGTHAGIDRLKQYGGTGRKFDWSLLKGVDIGKPFLLSGGIEPLDGPLIRAFLRDPVAKDLLAVDINSRFESTPGIKNMEKVRSFIEELHEF